MLMATLLGALLTLTLLVAIVAARYLGLVVDEQGRIISEIALLQVAVFQLRKGGEGMPGLQDVIDEIRSQRGVLDSVKVGIQAVGPKIQELRALLEAALAGNDPAKVQEALDLLNANEAELQQDAADIAAAVADPPTP